MESDCEKLRLPRKVQLPKNMLLTDGPIDEGWTEGRLLLPPLPPTPLSPSSLLGSARAKARKIFLFSLPPPFSPLSLPLFSLLPPLHLPPHLPPPSYPVRPLIDAGTSDIYVHLPLCFSCGTSSVYRTIPFVFFYVILMYDLVLLIYDHPFDNNNKYLQSHVIRLQ